MKENIGFILSAKFGLIILLFIMPFMTVSCSGMINIPLSGFDLATGTTLELEAGKKHNMDPEPFATGALGVAVLGVIVGLVKNRSARLVNAIAGGAGAVCLFLLKNKMDADVITQGKGMMSLHYETGFWLALILFILAGAVSLFAMSIQKE